VLVRRNEQSLSGARSQTWLFVSILHNPWLAQHRFEGCFYSSQVIDRIGLAGDEQRFAVAVSRMQ
jgi:hypothetical protein